MRVIISKYALSSGLFSVEAGYGASENMVRYKVPGSSFLQFAHGNEFHLCKDEAIQHANEKRIKKIASLKKQIDKLEAMKFEVREL